MRDAKTKILLVEDDEKQYAHIRQLLTGVSEPEFVIDWIPNYEAARDAIARYAHDACLVDYDLGERNGLELLREMSGLSIGPPIILLSDRQEDSGEQNGENGSRPLAAAALQAGAADCIAKDAMDRPLLIRAIRYAMERKRAEQVLYLREQEFKALVENSPDIIARFDRQLRHVYVNPAVESATGLPPQAFLGKTHRELGGPAEVVEEWEGLLNRVFETGQELEIEYPFCGPRGNRYYHSRLVPEPDGDGPVRFVLKVSRDITERRRIEEQLKLRDRAIQSSSDAIVILDARDDKYPIVYVNPAFERVTGYKGQDAIGQPWRFMQGADGAQQEAGLPSGGGNGGGTLLDEAMRNGKEASVVMRSYRRDGSVFWNDMRLAPIYDSTGLLSHFVLSMSDITERKSLEIEHARLLADALEKADRDPLTGFLNHRAFHKRLADEAERAVRENRRMAVAIMDLDNFRFLNDAYGHTTGDEVLREVADILRQRCPSAETLARFGGDEFALIMTNVRTNNIDEVEAFFTNLLADVDYCPPGHNVCVPISMCVGAAFLHESGSRLETLQRADDRLRRKKLGSEEQSELSWQLRTQLSTSIAGFAMLDALVTAVDNKDRYTRRHSEDVMRYSLLIADELGLDEPTRKTLAVAALLHDVGKTGVPDLVLRKPGGLTEDEYEIVKQHPMMGAAIVSAVPGMEGTLDCIRHHHERWDGEGYPFGLIREECPLLARLMAVADAMSAMTTDRPYRKAMPVDEALRRLHAGAGTQWDPACVDAMLKAQSNNLRFAAGKK
jgi:diguanylate cyclase (GGDEF)-like protein/PAS domain S-box-containing protein